MKKLLSIILSMAMLLSITAGIDFSAFAEKSNDYEYEILDDGSARIDAYHGKSSNLVIPDKLDNHQVTEIYIEAFASNNNIKSVKIPDSVKYIDASAFSFCENLSSISLPDGLTNIFGNPFIGTAYYYNRDNWENGVLYIGKYLLQADDTLLSGSYEIKPGTKLISNGAFSQCSALTGITVPDSITSISDKTFEDCTNLTEVKLPENSITSIGEAAFSGCKSLKNAPIPESVTSIGSRAFEDCISIKNLNISKNVKTISSAPFSGCSGLDSISVSKENPSFDSRNDCNAIIDKSENSLIAGCKNTVIPDGISEIGCGAFSGCTGLKNLTIPESVIMISFEAFNGCTGLTSIYIPKNVSYIQKNPFSYCSNLSKIVVDSKNEYFNSNNNCNAIICTATSLGLECNDLITGCKNTVIPKGVESIGDEAFAGCTGLKNISIPSGVREIGMNAFADCSGLKSISIPKSVTDISMAFDGCVNLKDVYYSGSLNEWKKLDISDDVLNNAKIHYSGSNTVSLSKANVSGIKNKTYNGKYQTQNISVKLGKTVLKNNKDFTVSYKNNKNVGTASLVIKGKGKYSGTINKTFCINPKNTAVKLSSGKKSFTAKWNKVGGVSGYQIQYSLKSNMKSSKIVNVKGNKKTKISVKKLKKGKKYYVRVRTYQKVGKKIYYSSWSSVKNVKAK